MSIIEVSGRVTIQRAEEILVLCRSAAAQGRVRVDWRAATTIDTAILQILIALSREPGVEFTDPPPPKLREDLALAGFQDWLDSLTWSRE